MAEASIDEFSIENILELKEEKPSESSSSGEAANKPNTMSASEDEASSASKPDESSSSGEAANEPNSTSAYEDEADEASSASKPEKRTTADDNEEEQASKHPRITLTSRQLSFLENIFAVYPYPDINAYRLLAQFLDVSIVEVEEWFINHRARQRKRRKFNRYLRPHLFTPRIQPVDYPVYYYTDEDETV